MREGRWRKKKDSTKNYDAMTGSYDLRYSEEQLEKYKTALSSLKLSADDSILDVGCGTGLFIQGIAESAAYAVGVDSSRRMLDRARSRCGDRANVCLVCGDADNLPFREKSFDRVFAFTLIQNMPDPEQTVHEMARVAKSRSRVVITGLKKSFTLEKFVRLLEKSSLTVIEVTSGEDLRDHVAICTRSE